MSRRAVMIALPLLVAGCGGSSASAPKPTTAVTTITPVTTTSAQSTTTTKAATPKPKPKPKPQPSSGSLPQTDQLPSAGTAGFRAEMTALWAGVQANTLSRAMPAFFPEAAYVQVKAIGDAQGDYAGRLVGDFRLDLAAAHALLGGNPASAKLVGVQVPQSYAHWIPPGVCANRVGYYEVPNARVVYRQNGAVRSFGIASMISWRGVWYVIHLGAILRSAVAGVVDAPSAGAGASVPSSTC